MEKFKVPTMVDSLMSSITTFHMMKIIIFDPSKFIFLGSVSESMYRCVSTKSKWMNEYKKLPPSAPLQLTLEMQNSLEATDKPAKQGKKPDRKGENKAAPWAPKKRKTKKKAHKPKAPSSSDSDYVPSDPQPEPESGDDDVSQHESSLRSNSAPPSPDHEGYRNLPPPSPTQSVPITIAHCPPPISSSTTTSIPIHTPLFTKVTTTTTTTTQPQAGVNVSDTGVPTSESEPPITSKPLSPPPSHESDIVLSGAEMEFHSVYFSPYRVQSDDDDDAPVTKKHLKNLNDTLDKMLSSFSSTPTQVYSEAEIKALLETIVKEHDTTISNVVKDIDASTSSYQKASIAIDESTKDCKHKC
ncbi:pollen-specific leucine-rich repeat extensin-like protein 2 [Lactuca sativa]|uniref:pollen-specific leucine-rich repeat extensin-like protein 2 n=1 Tax=Lactuca sativa TaxID=4236 RepID=UPI001C68A522|nr:pollen-specific leucine-rich repeat extensin-like protein 2 [Lactuca sativa]